MPAFLGAEKPLRQSVWLLFERSLQIRALFVTDLFECFGRIPQAEEEVRESEKRYRSLFEDCPISLWEGDSSEFKKYFDNLRSSGVKDFRTYFDDHPEEIFKCFKMIKIVDVNEATLEMYKAKNKEALINNLEKTFALTEESIDSFKLGLVALTERQKTFGREGVSKTLTGDQ